MLESRKVQFSELAHHLNDEVKASSNEVRIQDFFRESATDDRIHLIGQCITLLGKERIGMVVGDREFIGHKWLKYLKDKGIPAGNRLFCIRLPKSHHIIRLDGRVQQVEALVSQQSGELILQDCLSDRRSGRWPMGACLSEASFQWGYTVFIRYSKGFPVGTTLSQTLDH